MTTSEFDLAHQRAARIGALAELDEVRLVAVNAELGDPTADGPYRIQVGINPSVTQLENRLLFETTYRIEVRGVGEVMATELNCRYLATYSLPTPEEQDMDDLVAFGGVTVFRTVHPYLRELLHNLSSRLGLPSLTLGVFRVPISAPQNIPAKRISGKGPSPKKSATPKQPAPRTRAR